jgi:polysaccharide pyruvyl transferase WcaK-like protein
VRQLLLAGATTAPDPVSATTIEAFRRGVPDYELHVIGGARANGAAGAAGPTRALRARRAGAEHPLAGVVVTGTHAFSERALNGAMTSAYQLALRAKAARAPFALLGVEARGLQTRAARAAARRLVHMADLVVLRDATSAQELLAAGAPSPLRVGADPVWAAVEAGPEERARHLVAVVDSRGPAAGVGYRQALQALAGDHELVIQPWRRTADDAALAHQLAAATGASVLPAPGDLRDLATRCRRAAGVLAPAYHAVLAAAATGTPAVAVVNERSAAALARQLGLPVCGDGERLRETVAAALHAGGAPPERVASFREAAEAGFRLLRILLARGRSHEVFDIEGLQLEPSPWR